MQPTPEKILERLSAIEEKISQIEKQYSLVRIIIISFAVILFVYAAIEYYFYAQRNAPADEMVTDSQEILVQSDNTWSLQWLPAEALVDAAVGFSFVDTDIFFNKRDTGYNAGSFEFAQFGDSLSLPTYGIDTRFPNREGAVLITENGISGGSVTIDRQSFVPLKESREDRSCGYPCRYTAYDKDYRYSGLVLYPPLPIDADAATFVPLYAPDNHFTGLARDKNNLYDHYDTSEFHLVSDLFQYKNLEIDISTFESIGGNYFKDKNNVYHKTWQDVFVVKDADPISIYYVGDYYHSVELAKDTTHVYLSGKKILDADPKTFTSLGNSYYKDVKGIYYQDTFLFGADKDTFVIEEDENMPYDAIDKNYKYLFGTVVE